VTTAMPLREATLDDHAAIMGVLRRNGLAEVDYDRWARRWTVNPFRAKRPEIPMGWVIGDIPFGYEWNGRKLMAAVVSAWAVDAAHRTASLGLAAKFFAQEGVDLLVITTANNASGAVFRALRAEPIPCPGYMDRLVWITDYAAVSADRLRRRGVPAAPLAKYPAGLALRALDRARGRNRLGRRSGSVRPVEANDGRFDALWDRLRRRADRLQAVRDRAALSWHLDLSRGREPAKVWAGFWDD